jgi:chorismate dehydratase
MFNQKISVVSYLNAKPFIYGLMHAPNGSHFNYCLDIPAVCAAKLATNEVQIGLIPVAAMLDIQNPQIITDYCISAHEAVNSVFIFANSSIDEIHTIYLDPHSRSSNNLAKILLKYYWKKEVVFKERTIDIVSLKDGEAFVLIGDRTFGIQEQYQHVYDLATAWFNFTQLPFVFAAWVANKVLSADFIKEFNAVLAYGLANKNEVIKANQLANFDVADYLNNKINYHLSEEKLKSIELYLAYCKSL